MEKKDKEKNNRKLFTRLDQFQIIQKKKNNENNLFIYLVNLLTYCSIKVSPSPLRRNIEVEG